MLIYLYKQLHYDVHHFSKFIVDKTGKYPPKRVSSKLQVTQSIFICYPNSDKLVFHDHFLAILGVGVWEGMHTHACTHVPMHTKITNVDYKLPAGIREL